MHSSLTNALRTPTLLLMYKRTCAVEALLLNRSVSLQDVANMLQAEWLESQGLDAVVVDVTDDAIECTTERPTVPFVTG